MEEGDQTLTPSDTTGGNVRTKHKQGGGGQGVERNGPRPSRSCTDDRRNLKHSEKKSPSVGFAISDILLPVDPSGGALSNTKAKDGCSERRLLGDGKNCNGDGGSSSPGLGNDKCDSNAAADDEICEASVDKYTHKIEMPKVEDDEGLVKCDTSGAGDERKSEEGPATDLSTASIKQEDESRDREIQGDNNNSGTADAAALPDSDEKPETKPFVANDDTTDVKVKSADHEASDKEDVCGADEVRLEPRCSEDAEEESILEGLSKVNEAAAVQNLPLDMTMAAVERRETIPLPASQKPAKSESKLKSDSLRPVGRMLHDLGLDLVRQQVYNDLISIQDAKDSKNMLDEKEKEQLKRLTDAHAKLLVKNAGFQLPFVTCRCGYASSSANVVGLHEEFGSTYEIPFHACCMCENFKTRWPSQFVTHLDSVHDRKGRVQSKMAVNVCKYCPYEHKNQMRMEVHVAKCFKKFNLNTNLQPLPADCDVPLLGKSAQPGNPHLGRGGGVLGVPVPFPVHSSHQVAKQVVASTANVQPSVMEIGGQLYSLVHHNGKALFTSLRSQMSNSSSSSSSGSNAPSAGAQPGNFPRFVQPPARPVSKDRGGAAGASLPNQRREKCEMCDAMVIDREALWIHFRMMHKVELSKVSMIEKEPWMMCDVCTAKFWTYQGLARHSVQLHKRELAPPALPTKSFKCFLCLQVQTNPLNHLSTYHNITLLDMYHSRRCCMCNRRFRAAPAFEEHMVLQHHDIFANKDVLCTVLQALSTALSLKRQETTVQQRGATPMKSPQRINNNIQSPGSISQIRSMTSSATSPGQRSMLESPSASGRGHPSDMRKRGGHRRQSGDRAKESEASAASKTATTPKKTTEEDAKELNKLYKDYADIGRPILRSMRHRLSQGGTEKADNASPAGGSKSKDVEKVAVADPTIPSENAGASAELDSAPRLESDGEPSVKKVCLESLRNEVETNDSESKDNHKQLQEINNVEMMVSPLASETQKAS